MDANQINFATIAFFLHGMMKGFSSHGAVQRMLAEFKGRSDASPLPLKSLSELGRQKIIDSDRQFTRQMQDAFSLWGKTIDDQKLAEFTNECASLPEPSKESFPKWFKVARTLFLYLTGGCPENYPDLIRLVGSQKDSVITIGQLSYSGLEKEQREAIRDFHRSRRETGISKPIIWQASVTYHTR